MRNRNSLLKTIVKKKMKKNFPSLTQILNVFFLLSLKKWVFTRKEKVVKNSKNSADILEFGYEVSSVLFTESGVSGVLYNHEQIN